ncbi:MAG: BON domain-containing protein [Proteobacteria bacterium]|nr:BON domain-containing protein [Pseudomonadota bacterium]
MVDDRQKFWRVALVATMVMLSGAITSGCAIDAATTIAEDRPFNKVLTDTETKADITKRLLSPENNDLFFDVSTDSYEGRVMLTGSVKTARDRERAAALAQGLHGVKIIYNEIQVTNKGGFQNTANDAWINAKIKSKYIAEKGVKSINLRWRVVNGTVYLLGFARSEKERRIAIALAKDTKFVTGVIDHIAVK